MLLPYESVLTLMEHWLERAAQKGPGAVKIVPIHVGEWMVKSKPGIAHRTVIDHVLISKKEMFDQLEAAYACGISHENERGFPEVGMEEFHQTFKDSNVYKNFCAKFLMRGDYEDGVSELRGDDGSPEGGGRIKVVVSRL